MKVGNMTEKQQVTILIDIYTDLQRIQKDILPLSVFLPRIKYRLRSF